MQFGKEQRYVKFRLPHYSEKVPFLVAWAQKSGCTATLQWFFYHAGLLDEARTYVAEGVGLDIHDFEFKVFKGGRLYRRTVAEQLRMGKPVVNFVRCPYGRAFSSYTHLHNRFFLRMEKEKASSPGMEVRKSILREVYGADVGIEYPISFLEYLQWLRLQDLDKLEPHHRPQHSPIYDYPNIRHYRLENFSSVSLELEREFDLGDSSAHPGLESVGHHRKKADVSDRIALMILNRSVPLNASAGFQLPKVTKELLEGTEFGDLIGEIFSADIALYDQLKK